MNQDVIDKRKPDNHELRRTIDTLLHDGEEFLNNNFKELEIASYKYDVSKAIDNLDLEKELIYQLIEDYIIQILKAKIDFNKYIEDEDYESIRFLAHKNLGVARNLHIEDAKKLLSILLKENDLKYMKLCVKALEISAIKLIPLCAYETLELIQVRDSL